MSPPVKNRWLTIESMKVWILTSKNAFETYENIRFAEAAEIEGVQLELVTPEEFEIIATSHGKKSIFRKGKQAELPDCLIPRMGSETTYFALAVIRQMERLGVFVLNSGRAVEASKDKLASMQILSSKNLPIPKTMLAKFPLDEKLIESEFELPLVIKTLSGTHGKGIFLCENISQMKDLLDLLEESKRPSMNIIIQEFVSASKGKDIRIIVIGGRPIGAILRTARGGGFKANISAGGEASKMGMDKAAEWISVESAMHTGLEVAGVDLLFDDGVYKVCEVNSSPEFKGFESATGIDVPKLIFDYVKIRSGK